MRVPRIVIPAIVTVMVLAAHYAEISAQQLSGIVRSSGDGQPIARALLSLQGRDDTPAVSTLTDEQGRFVITVRGAGTYTMTVRRLGFHLLETDPFELAITQDLDIQVTLEPVRVELDPLEVVDSADTRPRGLVLSGFYERREAGFGRFVTREEFENWNPSRTTDVLRRVQGVTVIPNPGYGRRPSQYAPPDTRRWIVRTVRSTPGFRPSGECPPLYFLNGVYVGNGLTTRIDDVISVGDIEGIEAYIGPSQTPARFNTTGSDCGVLVFWTR